MDCLNFPVDLFVEVSFPTMGGTYYKGVDPKVHIDSDT